MSVNFDQEVALFRTVIASSNVPIAISDVRLPDSPLVFVNAAFELCTGYAANQVLGRNCRFLQASDTEQPARSRIAEAIRSGEPCEAVLRNYRRDGTMFWNHLYLYPVRSGGTVITHFVGIQHDVTAAVAAQAALDEKQAAIQNSIDPFVKIGRDGKILEANHAMETVFGWASDELIGAPFMQLLPEERRAAGQQDMTAQLLQLAPASFADEYQRKDGFRAIVEWTVSAGNGGDSVLAIGRDVTDRRIIEQAVVHAHERMLAVLGSITEGCFSLNRQWCFTYVNPQAQKWLGHTSEDLIGSNIWEKFPEMARSPFFATYQEALATETYAACEAYYAPLDRWLEARAYPSDEGLTVFFLDISDRKRAEAKLVYSATHDLLTGLINRKAGLEKLTEWLEQARHAASSVAVLFIDLDRFKEVNDALGHRVGDSVLAIIGQRLAGMATRHRVPARISGDEFIYILDGALEDEATAFANRLIAAVVLPIQVDGAEIAIGASVGVAVTVGGAVATDDLVSQADSAMYVSKGAGRHMVSLFSASVDQWGKQKMQLRRELPAALRDGQFVLHYQPQISLADDTVVGAEALLRWQHPQWGLLSPAAFLDIAEESSFILKLGAWVFQEACRQRAAWTGRLAEDFTIAVNVSARQLGDPDLPAMMEHSVREHGVAAHSIKIEVTESMLAQDFHVSANVLQRLKEKGFCIALDDFGTGYSNLAYLNRFPITDLKVDRSFICDMEHSEAAVALVQAIIVFAKSLKLTVVCEGVETQGQRCILEQAHCDVIQGYFVGRPMPADQFLRLALGEGELCSLAAN